MSDPHVSMALITADASCGSGTTQPESHGIPAGLDEETSRDSGSGLQDYFAGIKGELGQVDRLVGDAASSLVASFERFCQLARAQQEISQVLAQAAAGPAGGHGASAQHLLQQQQSLTGRMVQELDTTVTAMQFADLVAQLLGHTVARVEALEAALKQVASEEARVAVPRPPRMRIASAVQAANAAIPAKPVAQQGMQTGDIELF